MKPKHRTHITAILCGLVYPSSQPGSATLQVGSNIKQARVKGQLDPILHQKECDPSGLSQRLSDIHVFYSAKMDTFIPVFAKFDDDKIKSEAQITYFCFPSFLDVGGLSHKQDIKVLMISQAVVQVPNKTSNPE